MDDKGSSCDIQSLQKEEWAPLQASCEFESLASSLVKVEQIGLQSLEDEVLQQLLQYWSYESTHLVKWGVKATAEDISVSLGSLSFSIRRQVQIVATVTPGSVRRKSSRPSLFHSREAAPCGGDILLLKALQSLPCLSFFDKLSSITAHISIEVHLRCETQPSLDQLLSQQPSTPLLLLWRKWGNGKAQNQSPHHVANDVSFPTPLPFPLVHPPGRSVMEVQCTVQGLFYNIPIRQLAFTSLVPSFTAPPDHQCKTQAAKQWNKSASALRLRREEYHRVRNAAYHTAICRVLAPYILFPLHGITESPLELSGEGVLPSFSFALTNRTSQDHPLSGESARCSVMGFLEESHRRASSASREGRASSEYIAIGGRRSTIEDSFLTSSSSLCNKVKCLSPGEKIVAQIVAAFRTFATPYTESAAVPVVTEAVVRPGRFVVFFTAVDTSLVTGPQLHKTQRRRVAQRSAVPRFLIVAMMSSSSIDNGGVSFVQRGAYRVVESSHFVYEIVSRHPSSVIEPLYVLVHASYLNLFPYNQKKQQRLQRWHRSSRRSNAVLTESFEALYAEALLIGHQKACPALFQQQSMPKSSESVPRSPLSTRAVPFVGATTVRPHRNGTPRLDYVLHEVLSAAAPTTLATPPSLPSSLPSALSHTMPLKYIRLDPACLLGRGTQRAVAPLRTPISLDPAEHQIRQEETMAREIALQRRGVGGVALVGESVEALHRVRHLLDTGRGSVLRHLPSLFAPPQPWTPDSGSDPECRPPTLITHPAGNHAVVQWAAKFLVAAVPRSSRCGVSKEGAVDPFLVALRCRSGHSVKDGCLSVHHHDWWLMDQHAVHERIRLEFFLLFSDTYVAHPELVGVSGWSSHGTAQGRIPRGRINQISRSARQALSRREAITRLMEALNPSSLQRLTDEEMRSAAQVASYPYKVPDELVERITALESHLQRWGWRFQHLDSLQGRLCIAITHWPLLYIEGLRYEITAISALRHTVEELETVGGRTATAAATHGIPNPASCSLSLIIPSVFLNIFISRSCRGAVMFGDVLTRHAVYQILVALRCVEQYSTCAHGRPSLTLLKQRK